MASTRIRCWGWNSFGQLGYGHRRSVGADTSFLPQHAGDVPVDPVRHDPWMVVDAERELALQPYGRHGHELPFRSPADFFALGARRVGVALLVALLIIAAVALRRRRGAGTGASDGGGGGAAGDGAAATSVALLDGGSGGGGASGKRD